MVAFMADFFGIGGSLRAIGMLLHWNELPFFGFGFFFNKALKLSLHCEVSAVRFRLDFFME